MLQRNQPTCTDYAGIFIHPTESINLSSDRLSSECTFCIKGNESFDSNKEIENLKFLRFTKGQGFSR